MLWLTVLAGAERGINRLLALDATAKPRLAGLRTKVLAIHTEQPSVSLYILPQADGLRLASQWHGDVHCRIQAKAQDLLRLAKSAQKTQVLHGAEFVIDGDSAVLLELAAIVQDLELDWEFALSQWLGPVATHFVGTGLRQGAHWSQQVLRSLEHTLHDYLTEESRSLVGQHEAQYRFDELDALKLSLERLDARVARLTLDSSENA